MTRAPHDTGLWKRSLKSELDPRQSATKKLIPRHAAGPGPPPRPGRRPGCAGRVLCSQSRGPHFLLSSRGRCLPWIFVCPEVSLLSQPMEPRQLLTCSARTLSPSCSTLGQVGEPPATPLLPPRTRVSRLLPLAPPTGRLPSSQPVRHLAGCLQDPQNTLAPALPPQPCCRTAGRLCLSPPLPPHSPSRKEGLCLRGLPTRTRKHRAPTLAPEPGNLPRAMPGAYRWPPSPSHTVNPSWLSQPRSPLHPGVPWGSRISSRKNSPGDRPQPRPGKEAQPGRASLKGQFTSIVEF